MDYPLNNQPATDRYDRMQYKYCGKSGLQLPLISLGLWHNFGSVDNFSVATDMIKYAFDHGSPISILLITMVLCREVPKLISDGFSKKTSRDIGMR